MHWVCSGHGSVDTECRVVWVGLHRGLRLGVLDGAWSAPGDDVAAGGAELHCVVDCSTVFVTMIPTLQTMYACYVGTTLEARATHIHQQKQTHTAGGKNYGTPVHT